MSMIMHDIDNSLTKFENQDLVIVICKHLVELKVFSIAY